MQPSRWTHRVRLQDDTIEDAGWISHPFLLPPHSRVTTGKESNDNNNRRFALHPTEAAVQIILNSSQGFAPTSLTLAAEACADQWFIKVNGFADDRCSLSEPPQSPPPILTLPYIYLPTVSEVTASPHWGVCIFFQLKMVTEDKEEDGKDFVHLNVEINCYFCKVLGVSNIQVGRRCRDTCGF